MKTARSVLFPSPPEGEGLGERGRLAFRTPYALRVTFPLSPTLSLMGRGGHTFGESR